MATGAVGRSTGPPWSHPALEDHVRFVQAQRSRGTIHALFERIDAQWMAYDAAMDADTRWLASLSFDQVVARARR